MINNSTVYHKYFNRVPRSGVIKKKPLSFKTQPKTNSNQKK